MKKALMLLAASMLLAFSTVCVSAADYTPDTQGKYTVEYNVGTENPAGMYGMVAIKGSDAIIDTTNLSNIYYIDQTSANADGDILFADFAPKATDFEECTVFIGGPGYDTAEEIGKLKKTQGSDPVDPDVPVDPKPEEPTPDEPTTFAISGKVISDYGTTAATITVKDPTGAVVATTQAAADGTFSVSVAADTYDVVFTKKAHCSYTITDIDVAADVALGETDISSLAGEVKESNDINFYDLNEVLGNYLKKSTDADFNAQVDINDSGDINFYDLNVVLGNYLNKAITKDYSAQ